MQMTSNKTDTYRLGTSGYLIDIVTLDEYYESWLYHETMGVKDLMFGCLKEQHSYEDFIRMVEFGDLKSYIEFYEDEHPEVTA